MSAPGCRGGGAAGPGARGRRPVGGGRRVKVPPVASLATRSPSRAGTWEVGALALRKIEGGGGGGGSGSPYGCPSKRWGNLGRERFSRGLPAWGKGREGGLPNKTAWFGSVGVPSPGRETPGRDFPVRSVPWAFFPRGPVNPWGCLGY